MCIILCFDLICERKSDAILINCNNTRGRMAPKRELLKGPLRFPEPQLRATSYTQKPASKDEVSVRTGKEPEIPGNCIRSYVCILTYALYQSSTSPFKLRSPFWIHRLCNVESKRKNCGKQTRRKSRNKKESHLKECEMKEKLNSRSHHVMRPFPEYLLHLQSSTGPQVDLGKLETGQIGSDSPKVWFACSYTLCRVSLECI